MNKPTNNMLSDSLEQVESWADQYPDSTDLMIIGLEASNNPTAKENIMTTINKTKTVYKHDCEECKNLGILSDGKQLYDGYTCNGSLILRKSDEPNDYETRRIRTYRMFQDEPLFNNLLKRADEAHTSA